MAKINLYNCDCMDFMKSVPDKFYELAIVDPPYGIGEDGGSGSARTKRTATRSANTQLRKFHTGKDWDNSIPNKEYFAELFRVSTNQIIWGANYFVEHLSESKKGWIFWHKTQEGLTMSDGEIAYSSFDKPTRVFNGHRILVWSESPIHPTQKPIKLYKWLLRNYAKPGDKILDTHGGSFSHAIACYDLGFELDIMELDYDYFKAGKERYESHVAKYSPASEIPVTKKGEWKLF